VKAAGKTSVFPLFDSSLTLTVVLALILDRLLAFSAKPAGPTAGMLWVTET